jgi:hypothetical protein
MKQHSEPIDEIKFTRIDLASANEWHDLPTLSSSQIIQSGEKEIELVPAKDGYSIELSGNKFRYVKNNQK